MSIFKIKHWWSNDKLQNEAPSPGVQNASCLKVDKFNSHSDSDCILIGEGLLMKIYKPSKDQNASHLILETQFADIVLQIETGKYMADGSTHQYEQHLLWNELRNHEKKLKLFILFDRARGSEDRQIIVLHPQSYEIYQLKKTEGHTDAGDQNTLQSIIKHVFTRKANSLVCGSFGNIKTRDFICIQGLDGSLSFFDQDTFLFMCIFNDVIIPAPVCYIASCDSFVICKSTWVLEIFSYQQLRESSELNIRQNKKNIPQWIYNAGEEISYVQVIQTSSNFSSILALGERHLCCFQDNGLMKYMIQFDFMPICFCAYLIGWYYEPTSRLLVMVASEDSKLFVYEGTSLLWSCDLLSPAIAISRCFLKYLAGGIVTLTANGTINVGYLGTEPDLNANSTPMINEATDPEQIQEELEAAEESLQKILENKGDTVNRSSVIDQIVKIKADVGKPIQNLHQEVTNDNEVLHLLMCPVIVMLTCEDPKLIETVQITYVCCPPFICSESAICLDSINGTEIIETQVFLSSVADISDTRMKIMFAITDSTGKIDILSRNVLLPLSLYCCPVELVTNYETKLDVHVNNACIDFTKIFTDFTEEELTRHGSPNTVTFAYRTTKRTVTLNTFHNHYSIEASDTTEIASILDNFLLRLRDYYKRMGIKDFRFHFKYEKEYLKQVIHRFLKSIEMHAKERTRLKKMEDELGVLQRQFIVIQKRLLVQYGSLPPGDCSSLEFLMKDTHKRLIKCVNDIIQCRETVCRAGSTMSTVGRFIIHLLKQATNDEFKVKLIEEMMSLNSLYEDYQEWEEAVTQALSYILNSIFKQSEKDKEKLAAVTEQGILSHLNLKRFLKQMRMILDEMFSEALDETSDQNNEKVTRIEEFVEVL